MPCSDPSWIPHLVQKIMREKPVSVLDIGVGFGMGGMIARQYGDVWNGRLTKADWTTRIEGVEVFGKYIAGHQQAIYDRIYIGDALEIVPALDQYDMVLCIDVLEHFSKEDGRRLMGLIVEHGKHFLVTTPFEYFAQGAVYGNDAERHLSHWMGFELSEFGTVGAAGALLMVQS